MNYDIQDIVNEKIKRDLPHRKGLLCYVASWFPQSILYLLGLIWKKWIEPFKYGPLKMRRVYTFVRSFEWLPQAEIERYQNKRLRKLVEYVYEYVPYYQNVFRELQLTPSDFNSIQDLDKIPVLSKEHIWDNLEQFIPTCFSTAEIMQRFQLRSTSGSTGKQLYFFCDRSARYKREAFERWAFHMTNIKVHVKRVHIWSRPFVYGQSGETAWHNPYERTLSLSSLPHDTKVYRSYLAEIKRIKPQIITAPPSFMYALAQFARDANISDVQIPCFYSCYENLYSFQSELIKEQFGCAIYRWYASEENIISAVECPSHTGLHINAATGIVEIVDKDGKSVLEGESGRIICTGFDNDVMPFLRYDLGDVGSLDQGTCACGRSLPRLVSVDGRSSEILNYGNKTVYPATLSVIMGKVANVRESQFVQIDGQTLQVNLVPRPAFDVHDEKTLRTLLNEFFGAPVTIIINRCDTIPRTKFGKFKFVINQTIASVAK